MNIDKSVIQKSTKGDNASIALLYRLLYSCMMSICMRYQRNEEDAKEVMNSGFFNVIKSLETYNYDRPFIAWVRRIIINYNIDVFRRNKRLQENRFELEREMGQANVSYNEADLNFNAEELLDMIHSLPAMTRNVFNLFAIDGFSHKEIAEQLDISIGTSKWHVSNARKKLLLLLETEKTDKNIAI